MHKYVIFLNAFEFQKFQWRHSLDHKFINKQLSQMTHFLSWFMLNILRCIWNHVIHKKKEEKKFLLLCSFNSSKSFQRREKTKQLQNIVYIQQWQQYLRSFIQKNITTEKHIVLLIFSDQFIFLKINNQSIDMILCGTIRMLNGQAFTSEHQTNIQL